MKKILIAFITLFFITNSTYSQIKSKAKLSAFTQFYLLDTKTLIENKRKTVNYKFIQNSYFLSALIKTNSSVSVASLSALNILIGTKAGNIWTVQIPETKLNDLINLDGIDYIQIDEPINMNLAMARKTTRVDSVHSGIGLPLAYNGKNVVVGIIDVGFDYTHPTFYDTLGNVFRIKRVWEQKTGGTPPSGFSYGNEMTDSLSIVSDSTDHITEIHGTHVAGIAAGSGLGSPTSGKHRGVAYESDLVMVGIMPAQNQWLSTGVSDIIDGMNYIYNYANSVGKPAVVNLSWGCSIGPHDGSSLFSQACDNLTGPGKIFVVAAGNNGTDKIHVNKTFTATDTLLKTAVVFSTSYPKKKSWVDIWGEQSNPFQIKLSLYTINTLISETHYFQLNNTTVDTFIVGNLSDTCYFKLSLISSDFNLKPHALLDIYNKSNRYFCITIKNNSGTVHAWQEFIEQAHGYSGAFATYAIPGATAGNTNYTIGDLATTNSAITVGAYASKVAYTDVTGANWSYNNYVNVDKLVPFSSHGPTIDNRIKPEITAPGLTICSALNVSDTSYTSTGSNRSGVTNSFISPINNKTYYYGEASGTSMASPMTAGIIALFLQANPSLTPTAIKNIISQTAILDTYTTPTPNPTLWGAGKINAYQGLKQVLLSTNIQTINNQNNNFDLFPNPNNGEFIIKKNILNNEDVNVDIYNSTGVLIFSKKNVMNNNQNQFSLALPQLANGIYFTIVTSANQKSVFKTCIIK